MATYSDKLNRLIKALEARTGLSSLVQGSKAFQIMESVASELMQLEYKIEEYVNNVSLLTASGNYLDKIGENFLGIKRLEEVEPYVTESMKAIKFYVNSGVFGDINKDTSGAALDIVLPEGVLLEGKINNKTIRLRLSKTTELKKDESEKYVSAEFVQGEITSIPAGTIKVHNFKNYSQAVNDLLKISNTMPIASGREKESDTNYRFRINNALKSFPKTTYPGIYEAITTTPGVSNAFIERSSNGGGSFTAYVQGVTPITGDLVIEDVKDRLSSVVGPWVTTQILKPNYIGVTASISISTYGAIENADYILETIKDKINEEVNNFYGSEFYLNTLLKIVTSSHSSITTADFDYVHVYTGADDIRGFYEIDLEADSNPLLYISNKEKLIVEPIINSIIITVL